MFEEESLDSNHTNNHYEQKDVNQVDTKLEPDIHLQCWCYVLGIYKLGHGGKEDQIL